MEVVNGVGCVVEANRGGPPPPSPLTGCYLLIVIGEPYSAEHKDIILQRVAKGLLSWNLTDCMVDLEKELAIITEQHLEGEEARYGERLIQFASENLVTEILIHPVVSTLAQCVRNLLSSFTRHRHIIHAGYTFAANGSWALQDGTFSLADFSEAFQEVEVQRVIRAYENGISLDLHCSPEGDWLRLPQESFAKSCKVRVNPTDVLGSSTEITNFLDYLREYLIPQELESLLESSDVVGNIRFSRPTLYVFPGGQGDAALFGINGFNMLLDGGFSRKACFWDFVRHLDRLDAVLMTRLNNSNVNGISAVLRRKKQDAVYPQIGHFFCNIQERKALLSPDGDKDKDPLLINLLDEGQDVISNLRHLNLTPQVCYRDSEPINLYHKVGHGTLDMYVLSPAKDSKEVRDFLQKWHQSDHKLFANQRTNPREFNFPLQNLISICALLVWQPANPNDTITRILFPGSTPQKKIFEGLDRLKHLEFVRHATCSEKSLQPVGIIKAKTIKDGVLSVKKPIENKLIENNGDLNGLVEKQVDKVVKKSDSTESDKSLKQTPPKKAELKPKISKMRSDSQTRRKTITAEKKPSPTTPKKSLDNKTNGEAVPKRPIKPSPTGTPAKSAKDANNRKVIESKLKPATTAPPPKKEPSPPKPTKTVDRKPISRRPKPSTAPPKQPISPLKKLNGIHKPDSLTSRKSKLDKEGTTDSSTVSTPSADQDSILKKDISKLTPEELSQLKAQELADLKEEQEAVKEIEAVFRKGELQLDDSELRKVKDVSIPDDEKLESEEYLIIEKEVVQEVVAETKEDETQKLARDSEESEKQRKLSLEVEAEPTKPEEEDLKEVPQESQPDEKCSGNVESGATTTAPTLPEDERITLDDIKEDQQVVEEKHVKEETKEKDIPVIQLPPKTFETLPKLPPVVGIRLDKQSHMRDIVKTPDEVADLPVHEEADYNGFSPQEPKPEPEEQQKIIKQDELVFAETDNEKVINKEELKALTDAVLSNEAAMQADITLKTEEVVKEEETEPEVLCTKELTKSPDEEKDEDEHEMKEKTEDKIVIKEVVEVAAPLPKVAEEAEELIKTEPEKIEEQIQEKIEAVKEDHEQLTKLEGKLQELKEITSNISEHKLAEPEQAQPVTLAETPEVEDKLTALELEDQLAALELDKLELGRKSPKEREEDVIKIVAKVAEVLKSDAPLEEFKGKLPFTEYAGFTPAFTTELRETHITTCDSPLVEAKPIKLDDCPTIPEEPSSPKEEDKKIALLKESQELMEATSKMISEIKQGKSEDGDADPGTVHRMLVTASSEDGGEEIEICPPGTIIFSRSSESSGRSSPDVQSHNKSHKSSIVDTLSDSLATVKAKEAKETKITGAPVGLPEKSTGDGVQEEKQDVGAEKKDKDDQPEVKDKEDKSAEPVVQDNKMEEAKIAVLDQEKLLKEVEDLQVLSGNITPVKDEPEIPKEAGGEKSVEETKKSGSSSPVKDLEPTKLDVLSVSPDLQVDSGKVSPLEQDSVKGETFVEAEDRRSSPDFGIDSGKASPVKEEILEKVSVSLVQEPIKSDLEEKLDSRKSSLVVETKVTPLSSGKSTPEPEVLQEVNKIILGSEKSIQDVKESLDLSRKSSIVEVPVQEEIVRKVSITPLEEKEVLEEKKKLDVEEELSRKSSIVSSGRLSPEPLEECLKKSVIEDVKKLEEAASKLTEETVSTATEEVKETSKVQQSTSLPEPVEDGKTGGEKKNDLVIKSSINAPEEFDGKKDAVEDELSRKSSIISSEDLQKSGKASPEPIPEEHSSRKSSISVPEAHEKSGKATPEPKTIHEIKELAIEEEKLSRKSSIGVKESNSGIITPEPVLEEKDVSRKSSINMEEAKSGNITPVLVKEVKSEVVLVDTSALLKKDDSKVAEDVLSSPKEKQEEQGKIPLELEPVKDKEVEELEKDFCKRSSLEPTKEEPKPDEHEEPEKSGKVTPEPEELQTTQVVPNVPSGKASPELKEPKPKEGTQDETVKSGKSTPGLEPIQDAHSKEEQLELEKLDKATPELEHHQEPKKDVIAEPVIEEKLVVEDKSAVKLSEEPQKSGKTSPEPLVDHGLKETPAESKTFTGESGKASLEPESMDTIKNNSSILATDNSSKSGKATPEPEVEKVCKMEETKPTEIKLEKENQKGKASVVLSEEHPKSEPEVSTQDLKKDDKSLENAVVSLEEPSKSVPEEPSKPGKASPEPQPSEESKKTEVEDKSSHLAASEETSKSGKVTPESQPSQECKIEEKEITSSRKVSEETIKSGKVTPEPQASVDSKQEEPENELSRKSSIVALEELSKSKKATPEPVLSEEITKEEGKTTSSRKASIASPEEPSKSGKASPQLQTTEESKSLRKSSIAVSEELSKSEKLTPEPKEEPGKSGKVTSEPKKKDIAVPEEPSKSGKVTPEPKKEEIPVKELCKSGKATPESQPVVESTKEEIESKSSKKTSIAAPEEPYTSGKATPEPALILEFTESKPGQATSIAPPEEVSKSGKGTPEPETLQDADKTASIVASEEQCNLEKERESIAIVDESSNKSAKTTLEPLIVNDVKTSKPEEKESTQKIDEVTRKSSVVAEDKVLESSSPIPPSFDGQKTGKLEQEESNNINAEESKYEDQIDALDTVQELLEKTSNTIIESFSTVGDLCKSVIIDSTSKVEEVLEKTGSSLQETYDAVNEMNKEVTFEKCLESPISKSANELSETFDSVKEMTRSVVFEKCEPPSPNLETITNGIIEQMDSAAKFLDKSSSALKESTKAAVVEKAEEIVKEVTEKVEMTLSGVNGLEPPHNEAVKKLSISEVEVSFDEPEGMLDERTASGNMLEAEKMLYGKSEDADDEEEEEDDLPGSPMSITSQVAHSRSSSRYDFEEDGARRVDPMSMSVYGALTGEETVPSTLLYEITKAKFSGGTSEDYGNANVEESLQLDQLNKNGQGGSGKDVMTESFIGDLPGGSKEEKDPIGGWGKPLGLPSPAPPAENNRGTPKKERKVPNNVSLKNKMNDDRKRADSPSKYKSKKSSPIYVDLTYVPHHGNSNYSYIEFFKRIRARYYVFSGIEPSREVFNALLEAKQTWEDKDLEVTIIPTYDTDILGYWVAENEELLSKFKIDLSPSASRCTINLQDHETSCSAYRLEF